MRLIRASLAILAFPALSLANSPRSFPLERALIDQLGNASKIAVTQAAALETLEEIAAGKIHRVDEGNAKLLHLDTVLVADATMLRNPSVRAYAIRQIGASATDAALTFLEKIGPKSLGEDESGEIYPAVKIARYIALIARARDEQAKTELLESALKVVPAWAIDVICDRGTITSLPAVERAIEQLYVPSQGDGMIQSCQARMQLIRSDPNRIVALGSVLNVHPIPAMPFVMWAVSQLLADHSAAAGEQVRRIAATIAGLPDGDAERLAPVADMIQRAQSVVPER